MYILLYGLSDPRYKFLLQVVNDEVDLQGHPKLIEGVTAPYVIDRYNYGINDVLANQVDNSKLTTLEELKKIEDKWLGQLSHLHKQKPLWKNYWQCMQWNRKNRLWNIFKQVIPEKKLLVNMGFIYYLK